MAYAAHLPAHVEHLAHRGQVAHAMREVSKIESGNDLNVVGPS